LSDLIKDTRQIQVSTNIVLKSVSEKADSHDVRIKKIETYDVNARLNDFQKMLVERVVVEMVSPTQLDHNSQLMSLRSIVEKQQELMQS
jgi:hypothetical protein